jgi:signal transduction histidine kinase
MNKQKNKRTLRKRIRKALNLSAFIPVVFLSLLVIGLLFIVSRGIAGFQVEAVGTILQQDINSGKALKTLGIRHISELDPGSPITKKWLDDASLNNVFRDYFSFSDEESVVFITIIIEDEVIFTNEELMDRDMLKLYEAIVSEKSILDAANLEIGTVRVQINPMFSSAAVVGLLAAIVIFGLLALFVSKILSLFLVIPITNPIRQLEIKMKAVSDGDVETAMHTELVLKRPLREMESLADSTNTIIRKIHDYSVVLENQKELLEMQKETVENQKEMVENQKEVLENQNAELEMQNEELIKSKDQIQQQQGQLIQSEKMASVGLLTAAITHEINTPMGAINSNVQLEDMLLSTFAMNPLILENEELSTAFAQLKEVNDINLVACGRIIEIIKSLKTFSRIDQSDFQEADINDGIKSVLVLTRNLIKNRITVHEDYGDFPPIRCFPGQLNQVIMNIVVNATQAIEGEGELFIRTYQQDRNVYISIKDTGAGIKPEDISKLYDPGFTTKGVGVGLGLGLYLSYNIMKNHNGDISVSSELGKGAEFTLRIPMDNNRT